MHISGSGESKPKPKSEPKSESKSESKSEPKSSNGSGSNPSKGVQKAEDHFEGTSGGGGGGDGGHKTKSKPSLTGGASAGFGSNPGTLSTGPKPSWTGGAVAGFGTNPGTISTRPKAPWKPKEQENPVPPPQANAGTTAYVKDGLATIGQSLVKDPLGTLGVIGEGLKGFGDGNAWAVGASNAGQFLKGTGIGFVKHMVLEPAQMLADGLRTAGTAYSSGMANTANGMATIGNALVSNPAGTLKVIGEGLEGFGDTNAWAQGLADSGSFLKGVAQAPVSLVKGGILQFQELGAAAGKVWNNGASGENIAALADSVSATGTTIINTAAMAQGVMSLARGRGLPGGAAPEGTPVIETPAPSAGTPPPVSGTGPYVNILDNTGQIAIGRNVVQIGEITGGRVQIVMPRVVGAEPLPGVVAVQTNSGQIALGHNIVQIGRIDGGEVLILLPDGGEAAVLPEVLVGATTGQIAAGTNLVQIGEITGGKVIVQTYSGALPGSDAVVNFLKLLE